MMKEEEENEKVSITLRKKTFLSSFHRQIQKKIFFITQTLYIVIRLHIYYLFFLNNDDDEKNDEKTQQQQ